MCQGCLSLKAFEKPLSAKEEKEMIERFHNGDMEARNILVERNMRLVAYYALFECMAASEPTS